MSDVPAAPEPASGPDAVVLAAIHAALDSHAEAGAYFDAWLYGSLPKETARNRYRAAQRRHTRVLKAAGPVRATTPAGLYARALLVRTIKGTSAKHAVLLAEELLANPELRRAVWPSVVEGAA